MKKILILVIILVAAFMMYNFTMTGKSTFRGSDTVIDFTPKEVKAGQTITIDLTPSKEGVKRLMSVHTTGHLRKDTTDAWGQDCANAGRTSTGTKCAIPWTFDYRVPIGFKPGQYYFRFYDFGMKDYIASDSFTVIE